MKNLRTSRKFKLYRQVGKLLSEAHPQLFPSRGRRPPLKQGILQELIALHAQQTSATSIRVFLSIWTRSTSYLMSVSKGGPRNGIGSSVGCDVTEGNRLEASRRIRERRMRTRAAIVNRQSAR